jgi:cytochrome oxidase assembly protein ShyY1
VYRFLLQPRWVLLHVVWLLAVVTFIAAGFWQLDRLDQKRTVNDAITARSAMPVVPVDEVVAAGDPVSVGDDVVFRTVTATGTYVLDDQALLRGQSLDGTPGFHVLTPLDLGDGTAVVVNRGWIPAAAETDGSDVEFDTPTGTVTVEGIVGRSYPDPRPSGDEQRTIAHVDLEWFDEQVDADLYPVPLQLLAQDPAQQGELPRPLDPPPLDEGPHLSYAVQWFLFTTVALIGYPILLHRIAHQRAGRTDGADAGAAGDAARAGSGSERAEAPV